MSTRMLAETVILQAMEDLYNVNGLGESADFFNGDGFVAWARLAGLSDEDREQIRGIVGPFLATRTQYHAGNHVRHNVKASALIA